MSTANNIRTNASTQLRSFSVVMILFLAASAIFFLRLIYLQVIVADDYSASAEESRTIYFETCARRGTIYDRNGVVLAVSVDCSTIYCNPSEVTNADSEAQTIASVLGGEKADYLELLEQESSTFVYIGRQIDEDKAQTLEGYDLDGIYFLEDTRREYPNGSVGSQVIGLCDIDGNGISGLELYYDETLKGENGVYSAQRGEDGTPIPGGVTQDTEAVDGEDIMISLDIRLQETTEQALVSEVERVGSESGSSLVMDSSTGEIYAAASYPLQDPNNLDEMKAGADNLICITQAIEPGSMFKTVTASAVLEKGTLEPDDELYVPASLQADEYTITDAHERGDETMTFQSILSRSSNVGISLALQTIGFEDFYDFIIRMNLDEYTGVDFPGEGASLITDVDSWSSIAGYNIAFGQGLTVTPIQLMRFYGAICADGFEVTPHFLISYPQENSWVEYDSEQVITDSATLEKIRYMLRTVVDSGTGTSAAIDGYAVVGKTSTAEIADATGGYLKDTYNHCFGGFIENSNSELVCYASVNNCYAAEPAKIFHGIMVEAIDLYDIVPE